MQVLLPHYVPMLSKHARRARVLLLNPSEDLP